MALKKNELYATATVSPFPRIKPTQVKVKQFATSAGAELLSVGHPVAVVTSSGDWAPLDGNAATGEETILGFVYPDPIQLSATEEVLGQTMLGGDIHYDDVSGLGVGGSEIDATQGELDAALKEDCRKVGIHVDGLVGVR